MSSTTSRLGLYLPADDGSENVNVATDLNDNLERLDVAAGFLTVTSSTRPAAPFSGQAIRESDTLKHYVHDGSVPASAGWTQVLAGNAAFSASANFNSSVTASGGFNVYRPLDTDYLFRGFVLADTQPRLRVDGDGSLNWGPGASTVPDTDLYRTGVAQLTTGGALVVVGALSAGGVATLAGGAAVTGNFTIGGQRYQNKASSTVTIANTTTETILGNFSVPANDAAAGAVFRIRLIGLGSCTGTPTFTFRARVNGTGGSAYGTISVTFSSGVTNHTWSAELHVSVISTGVSGSSRGFLFLNHSLDVAGAAPFNVTNRQDGTAAVTMNTTAVQNLCITGQWGTANASNTLSCYVAECERIS